MARGRRIDRPGLWHHVINRVARRSPIFRRDEHCEIFLDCLSECVERYGLEIHAYSLMPNHYHLLVCSPLGNLSRAMRHLNGIYTQRLNRRFGWDGPVFRGRFRSQIVPNEEYRKYLFGYIHLNPVRAGLARRIEENCWTSLRVYLGKKRAPEWLTTAYFARALGGAAGAKRWVERLRKRPEEWEGKLDLESGLIRLAPKPDEFVTKQAKKDEKTSIEKVLREVRKIAGCSRDEIQRRQMGPFANPARRFAVWALARKGRYTQREIGEALDMSSNQVAKVCQRLSKNQAPKPLRDWMAALMARK